VKNLIDKFDELLSLNSIFLPENSRLVCLNYVEQLLNFNKKINLISRKDENNIIEKHIIPCLIFSTLFKSFEGIVLDIGTGGGLPGIPFSIVNPKSRITLIDSINKKVLAVKEIVQIIGLDNVEVVWTRAEDNNFIKNYGKSFDLIISRAVADLKTLISYSFPLLKAKESKIAVMKGGDELDQEITEAKKRFNYIVVQKIPLIYLPENPDNINKKYIVIVERINGRK
jgi:16S rRNA (guanine527-N7)-methyltransferase